MSLLRRSRARLRREFRRDARPSCNTGPRTPHLRPLSSMAVALALPGCFYGYGTDVSVTRLTAAVYPPTESITLYFRPIAKDERCVPIALLEVAGSRSEDTADALHEIRREAVEVGADSIFSVT